MTAETDRAHWGKQMEEMQAMHAADLEAAEARIARLENCLAAIIRHTDGGTRIRGADWAAALLAIRQIATAALSPPASDAEVMK